MLPRNRYTLIKVLAFVVGGTLALLSSFNDITELQVPMELPGALAPQSAQLRSVRSWDAPPPQDAPGEGRQRPKPEAVHGPDGDKPRDTERVVHRRPHTPPKPLVVDTSKLGPIVNPQPFGYKIAPPRLCEDPNLFLVIYIHSAPQNIQRRSLLRKTWGDTSQYADKVVLFFMMGVVGAGNSTLQGAVEEESKQYNDIVQGSFVDAYHNISYKAASAMRWVSEHCNHTKFILKSDDDVFVNTYALLKHMHDLDNAQVNTTGLLLCLTWYRMHVLRDGKWNISTDIIADEFYPHYCSGMGYIMTPDVARALYLTSQYVPFFWVDDVYITGMLPKKINLTHVNFVKAFMGRKEIDWLMSGEDWYKYVFCHLHDQALFQKAWNKVVAHARSDVIPDRPDVIVGKLADKYGPKKSPEMREAEAKRLKKEKEKKEKEEKAAQEKGKGNGKKKDKPKKKQEDVLL